MMLLGLVLIPYLKTVPWRHRVKNTLMKADSFTAYTKHPVLPLYYHGNYVSRSTNTKTGEPE